MNITKLSKQIIAFASGLVLSWCAIQLLVAWTGHRRAVPMTGDVSEGTTAAATADASTTTRTSELPAEVRIDLSQPEVQQIINRERMAFKSVNSSGVYLVVLVKSTPKAYLTRGAVRTSWFIRENRTHRSIPNRLLYQYFLVGQGDAVTEVKLADEQEQFADLVRVPFVDDYAHLAPKVLYGLQYASSKHAFEYLLVTEEDTLVNWQTFLPWIASATQRKVYAGRVVKDRRVDRTSPKLHVPKEVYQPDTYPPLADGFGYVMSMDVVRGVLGVSHDYALAGEDDAMMAILTAKIGVAAQQVNEFQQKVGCSVKFPAVLGGVSGNMLELHHKALQRVAVC